MRIMRSPEQWQTIIQEQQSSGLTIIDYCQQHQLPMTSFYAVKKNSVYHRVTSFAPKLHIKSK